MLPPTVAGQAGITLTGRIQQPGVGFEPAFTDYAQLQVGLDDRKGTIRQRFIPVYFSAKTMLISSP